VSIAAEVEEAMFGGALTKLLLRSSADPAIRLDIRLSGADRASAPAVGDKVSITYDPADAVVVTE
jgi:hypothetical protein